MDYNPGTHLIATLHTGAKEPLRQFGHFQQVVDALIAENDLHKLGEVYHNFNPQGFTGVVCLSESHLSVHTWPEHGKVNIDIYLSNFKRMNDGTVHRIYEALQRYFGGAVETEQIIKR